MKEIDFVPRVCKGDAPLFEGFVKLRLPSFDERMKYLEDAGVVIKEDGTVDHSLKQMSAVRKLVQFSAAHYIKVSLKKVEDGSLISNFEELTLDPDCDGILIEVASSIASGLKPSKN